MITIVKAIEKVKTDYGQKMADAFEKRIREKFKKKNLSVDEYVSAQGNTLEEETAKTYVPPSGPGLRFDAKVPRGKFDFSKRQY
jgi:hypothetical protein